MVSVTISSFAQEGASVFKNYKYRFQKYRLLTTNFNLGNNNSINDNIQHSNVTTTTNSNLNFSGNIQFTNNINTQKLQQFTHFNGGLGFTNTRNSMSFNNYSTSGNGSSIIIDLNQQNRFYKNNYFFEVNYHITSNEAYGKSKVKDLPAYNNFLDLRGNINIGAGNGRLEMVGDVAQALFILTDFKNRGIITHYTDEDATALAKQITKIYNTRIIDFRYRLRGQLGMLDSFFTTSGLIDGSKPQSVYFISLFDNWLNNNYVQRFCGSRFSYGVSYGNQYLNNYSYKAIPANYLSNQTFNNYYTPGIYFNYTNEKPISLHWQESFSADINVMKNYTNYYNYKVDTNTISILKSKFSNYNSLLKLSYKLSWYPNSRTYLNAGITTTLLYNPSDAKTWKTTPVSLSLTPFANLFYFVSPKVNFNITFTPVYYFSHQFVNNSSYINTQVPAFGAGLNYYIY